MGQTPQRRAQAPSEDRRAAPSFLRELETRLTSARLSHNDRRILEFIRDHLDELGFHTSESIAQGANVSRAAVVRFARRLGYGGFADLRTRYRELSVGEGDGGGEPQDTSSLARKIQRDVENLQLLPGLLGDRLDGAAQAICDARRFWLLANRETQALTAYLYRLLHQIRRNLSLIDPAFPDPLRDAGEGDAVLVCTFRPYSRQTVELLAHVRAAGAATIVMTDGERHRFLRPQDIVLPVPVQSPTMFLSFTAAFSALEALAAAVARTAPQETSLTLEKTGAFAAGQRLMLEPGLTTGLSLPPGAGAI
jgi:DNA-binding MurR/RpiR family transcriptional regulator